MTHEWFWKKSGHKEGGKILSYVSWQPHTRYFKYKTYVAERQSDIMGIATMTAVMLLKNELNCTKLLHSGSPNSKSASTLILKGRSIFKSFKLSYTPKLTHICYVHTDSGGSLFPIPNIRSPCLLRPWEHKNTRLKLLPTHKPLLFLGFPLYQRYWLNMHKVNITC